MTVSQIENNYAHQQDKSPEAANKSIRSRITGLLYYIVLIVIVLCAYQFSGAGSAVPRNVFGYSAMTVLTGSMQQEIPKGSLIITKQVDPQTIQIGDDITYMKDAKTSITHRVVGIYENYDNKRMRGFQTQGVNNINPDAEIVLATNVVGKVIYHSEKLGAAVNFIKGNTLLIGVVAALTGGLYCALRALIESFRSEPRQSSGPRQRKSSEPRQRQSSDPRQSSEQRQRHHQHRRTNHQAAGQRPDSQKPATAHSQNATTGKNTTELKIPVYRYHVPIR
ncbi:MAG: signal peptidase I [Coriobacteriia bacterium]|nr:signal peptidase I [Coriobacteriia bacterium]